MTELSWFTIEYVGRGGIRWETCNVMAISADDALRSENARFGGPHFTNLRAYPAEKYIIELESGVWLAGWSGDPGRTLVKESAKMYTRDGAAIALGKARKFRPFKNAVITAV